MRNKILFIILFSVYQLTFSQKVKIDSEIEIEETKLETKIGNQKFLIGTSVDNKDIDSLVISIVKFGGGPGIKLTITDSIIPKIYFWADYGKFNGKNEVEYGLKYYSLTLNKTNFKIGDTLMGKVEFLSKPIKHLQKKSELYFKGEIMHIIGTNIKVIGKKRTLYKN